MYLLSKNLYDINSNVILFYLIPTLIVFLSHYYALVAIKNLGKKEHFKSRDFENKTTINNNLKK